MGAHRARNVRLRRAAALIAVPVAMAAAAGCSHSDGATGLSTGPAREDACAHSGQRPSHVTLCADAGTLRPGAPFTTWVIGGDRTTRGLALSLEVWRDGAWRTAATLVAPLPHDENGEPGYHLGDRRDVVVFSIGIGSRTRLRYVMPPVPAGRYRLSANVTAEPPDGSRATVVREIAVVR